MKLIDSEELLKFIDKELDNSNSQPSRFLLLQLKGNILSMQPASWKMGVEEAKDKVATEYCRIGGQPKCDNWQHFLDDRTINGDPDNEINKATNEAIILYAQQFNPHQ